MVGRLVEKAATVGRRWGPSDLDASDLVREFRRREMHKEAFININGGFQGSGFFIKFDFD